MYLLVIGLALASAYLYLEKNLTRARQEAIREKGSLVMPFDLSQTTHIFQKTDTGGVQQVRVKDASDKEQIAMVQSHLKKEAERFSQGDFSDPQALHGESMPGLSVLAGAQGRFTVEYVDLVDGGQINYITGDEEVLDALHMWFMAQLQDHGADAMEHM